MVQGQHRQKLARPCLTNKLKAKRAGGVAQVTTKKAKKKKKKHHPNLPFFWPNREPVAQ
jgi:hypothetical protein